MYNTSTNTRLQAALQEMAEAGTYKRERLITSPQGAGIVADEREVLNFCANNYLGLADHPNIVSAARATMTERGFGLASVRFICGTQDLHAELESRLSEFLGCEETILFPSCFDANAGIFEALFTEDDVIISDELNHASLIDGIRLCKARRLRYGNRDMDELEARLRESQDARTRVIVTDGVFSMDGYLAPLREICDLADRYDAIVMVDDSHAVGFLGANGRGTPELLGVEGRVDIYTGTLGKALGGGTGGYVSSYGAVVQTLRQRARPYLFSNTLMPSAVAGALAALDLVEAETERRERVGHLAARFRQLMTDAGFDLLEGQHPIVPVMFYDAALASRVAEEMLLEGIYVVAFSYPVVPPEKARIRVQLSAAHSDTDVARAVEAFVAVRRRLGTAS